MFLLFIFRIVINKYFLRKEMPCLHYFQNQSRAFTIILCVVSASMFSKWGRLYKCNFVLIIHSYSIITNNKYFPWECWSIILYILIRIEQWTISVSKEKKNYCQHLSIKIYVFTRVVVVLNDITNLNSYLNEIHNYYSSPRRSATEVHVIELFRAI